MKHKFLLVIFVLVLAGCGTASSLREHEVSANLPRAQGIGAWTPSCIFFCFAEAHYAHGDDTIDPSATEALMKSRLYVEQSAKGNIPAAPPMMFKKGVKKPPPKLAQGAKP